MNANQYNAIIWNQRVMLSHVGGVIEDRDDDVDCDDYYDDDDHVVIWI